MQNVFPSYYHYELRSDEAIIFDQYEELSEITCINPRH